MSRLALAALLAAVLAMPLAVSPVQADQAEAEALFSRYHQAIESAKQCRKLSFDHDAQARMGGVINAKIKHKIGAKRLSLLTAAQREARALIQKQGCKGSDVGALLGLFDRDLKPVL